MDDNKSVASSVISDFKLPHRQRLLAAERLRDSQSKNNLIEDSTTPSLDDYYIADGSETNSRTDTNSDTARLIISQGSTAHSEVAPRVVNGNGGGSGLNGDRLSASAEEEVEDESAALLTDTVNGAASKVTSI